MRDLLYAGVMVPMCRDKNYLHAGVMELVYMYA